MEAYVGRYRELRETAEHAFRYWIRPNGPNFGLSVYRNSPPRKFNWWFKNNADMDFLLHGAITPEVPAPASAGGVGAAQFAPVPPPAAGAAWSDDSVDSGAGITGEVLN
jgi:hypothetical protein